MQTNQEFFATLTVVQLKARLADFNATGISKLRKFELVSMLTCLMDGAHIDATNEGNARINALVAKGVAEAEQTYRKNLSKSYNERMLSRLAGYHTQNGLADMVTDTDVVTAPRMMAKLTPKQRKRYTKKYNRQYGKLVASL